MTTFFGIIGMLGSAVCAAWLIIQWIRKQPKKLPLICLAASLVLMVLILLSLAVMNRYSDEGEGGLVA